MAEPVYDIKKYEALKAIYEQFGDAASRIRMNPQEKEKFELIKEYVEQFKGDYETGQGSEAAQVGKGKERQQQDNFGYLKVNGKFIPYRPEETILDEVTKDYPDYNRAKYQMLYGKYKEINPEENVDNLSEKEFDELVEIEKYLLANQEAYNYDIEQYPIYQDNPANFKKPDVPSSGDIEEENARYKKEFGEYFWKGGKKPTHKLHRPETPEWVTDDERRMPVFEGKDVTERRETGDGRRETRNEGVGGAITETLRSKTQEMGNTVANLIKGNGLGVEYKYKNWIRQYEVRGDDKSQKRAQALKEVILLREGARNGKIDPYRAYEGIKLLEKTELGSSNVAEEYKNDMESVLTYYGALNKNKTAAQITNIGAEVGKGLTEIILLANVLRGAGVMAQLGRNSTSGLFALHSVLKGAPEVASGEKSVREYTTDIAGSVVMGQILKYVQSGKIELARKLIGSGKFTPTVVAAGTEAAGVAGVAAGATGLSIVEQAAAGKELDLEGAITNGGMMALYQLLGARNRYKTMKEAAQHFDQRMVAVLDRADQNGVELTGAERAALRKFYVNAKFGQNEGLSGDKLAERVRRQTGERDMRVLDGLNQRMKGNVPDLQTAGQQSSQNVQSDQSTGDKSLKLIRNKTKDLSKKSDGFALQEKIVKGMSRVNRALDSEASRREIGKELDKLDEMAVNVAEKESAMDIRRSLKIWKSDLDKEEGAKDGKLSEVESGISGRNADEDRDGEIEQTEGLSDHPGSAETGTGGDDRGEIKKSGEKKADGTGKPLSSSGQAGGTGKEKTELSTGNKPVGGQQTTKFGGRTNTGDSGDRILSGKTPSNDNELKEGERYSHVDKSIKHINQQAVMENDIITVSSKLGNKVLGKFEVSREEWEKAKREPTLNEHFNRRKLVKEKFKEQYPEVVDEDGNFIKSYFNTVIDTETMYNDELIIDSNIRSINEVYKQYEERETGGETLVGQENEVTKPRDEHLPLGRNNKNGLIYEEPNGQRVIKYEEKVNGVQGLAETPLKIVDGEPVYPKSIRERSPVFLTEKERKELVKEYNLSTFTEMDIKDKNGNNQKVDRTVDGVHFSFTQRKSYGSGKDQRFFTWVDYYDSENNEWKSIGDPLMSGNPSSLDLHFALPAKLREQLAEKAGKRIKEEPETSPYEVYESDDPWEFQNTNQEKWVHGDAKNSEIGVWEKGNQYRYVLEAAGDVFREFTKIAKGGGAWDYIDEKLNRIKKRLLKERTKGIHIEDSFENARVNNKNKFEAMEYLWDKKQPVKTKLQKMGKQLNLSLLRGDFQAAEKLISEIDSYKPVEPAKTEDKVPEKQPDQESKPKKEKITKKAGDDNLMQEFERINAPANAVNKHGGAIRYVTANGNEYLLLGGHTVIKRDKPNAEEDSIIGSGRGITEPEGANNLPALLQNIDSKIEIAPKTGMDIPLKDIIDKIKGINSPNIALEINQGDGLFPYNRQRVLTGLDLLKKLGVKNLEYNKIEIKAGYEAVVFNEKGENNYLFLMPITSSTADGYPKVNLDEKWSKEQEPSGMIPLKDKEKPVKQENYDLRGKERVQLTKGQREKINESGREILDKIEQDPDYVTSDEEKEILRQYTGKGGLGQTSIGALNQHYTDYDTIEAMYSAIEKAGVKFTEVLEPGAGSGNFVGLRPGKSWTVVDIDKDNIGVLKGLYPAARHYHMSYENFTGSGYDLAISNVPFLETRGNKRVLPEVKTLHDFYFVHTIDRVKDNGVIAFITSTGTMDRQDSKIREMITARCDVIGCYRLPQGHFKKTAHTDVMVDIIFLQKRPEGADSRLDAINKIWLETVGDDEGRHLNKYYEKYPDNILGELVAGIDKLYGGRPKWVVEGEADLSKIEISFQKYQTLGDKLKEREEKLSGNEAPKNYIGSGDHPGFTTWAERNGVYYRSNIKMGSDEDSFSVKDEKYHENIVWEKDNIYMKDKEISFDDVSGTVKVYKKMDNKLSEQIKLLEQIQKNIDNFQETGLSNFTDQAKRDIQQYKRVYKLHPNKDKKLQKLFKDQGEETFLLQLGGAFDENFKEADSLKEQTRWKGSGKIKITAKSDIKEKAFYNENNHGIIDLNNAEHLAVSDIAELAKNNYAIISKTEVQNDILYYSGMIYNKIEVGEKLLRSGLDKDLKEIIEKQIVELQKILPKPKSFDEIHFNIANPWVKEFYRKIFERVVEGKDRNNMPEISVYDSEISISDREILNDMINHRLHKGKATDETDSGNIQRNRERSEKAEELAELIEDRISKKPELKEQIERTYNRKFNGYVSPDYQKASYLVRGAVEEANKNMRKAGLPGGMRINQVSVVAKCFSEGKGINAQDVGAGKTISGVVLGKALKDKGAANKPLYVVPAKTIPDWVETMNMLYPGSKIINLGSLTKDNREKQLFNLSNTNADFVICSTEALNNFSFEPENYRKLWGNVIKEMRRLAPDEDDRQNQLNIVKLQEFGDAMADSNRGNPRISFEKMGIDAVIVDEAHAFKNFPVPNKLAKSSTGRNLGAALKISKEGKVESYRSVFGRMIFNYISSNNNGKNVFFLTGTPTSNAPLELYTMLKHLDPNILEEYGIETAFDFADTFFETRSGTYLNMKGKEKSKEQLFELINMTLLRKIRDRFIDHYSISEMPWITRPAEQVVWHPIELSPEGEMIAEDIISRLDAISPFDSNSESIIAVYNAGRAASVDTRLYKDRSGNNPVVTYNTDPKTSRIAYAIELIQELRSKGKKKELDVEGILVFLDMQGLTTDIIPRGGILKEMKDELVRRGEYKQNEVALITGKILTDPATGIDRNNPGGDKTNDGKKLISDLFNSGKIKLVLGTSRSMGEGMNFQGTGTDGIYLDFGYKPDKLIQMKGRILRQGNPHNVVRSHYIVQKGSLDGLVLDLIMSKKGWGEKLYDKGLEDTLEVAPESGGVPTKQQIRLNMERDPENRIKLRNDMEMSKLHKEMVEERKLRDKLVKNANTERGTIHYLTEIYPKRGKDKLKGYNSELERLKADYEDSKAYFEKEIKRAIAMDDKSMENSYQERLKDLEKRYDDKVKQEKSNIKLEKQQLQKNKSQAEKIEKRLPELDMKLKKQEEKTKLAEDKVKHFREENYITTHNDSGEAKWELKKPTPEEIEKEQSREMIFDIKFEEGSEVVKAEDLNLKLYAGLPVREVVDYLKSVTAVSDTEMSIDRALDTWSGLRNAGRLIAAQYSDNIVKLVKEHKLSKPEQRDVLSAIENERVDDLPFGLAETAREFSRQMEIGIQYAEEMGVIGNALDNYVPHLYEEFDKAEKEYVGGELNPFTKHGKMRVLENLEEAEAMGLTPVTDLRILSYRWWQSVGKAVADRNLVEELKNIDRALEYEEKIFSPKLRPGYEPMIEPALVKWYYTGEIEIVRDADTIEEGVEEEDLQLIPPEEYEEPVEEVTLRMKNRDKRHQKVVAGSDDNTSVMLAKQDVVYVRKDFVPAINAALEKRNLGRVEKGYLKLKNLTKRILTYNILFHGMTLYSDLLLENNMNVIKAVKQILGNHKGLLRQFDYSDDNELLVEMAVNGVKLTDALKYKGDLNDYIEDSLPEFKTDKKLSKKIFENTPVGFILKMNDKYLWKMAQNSQVAVYLIKKATFLRKGYSPEIAGRMAGHFVNDQIGSLPKHWFKAGERKWLNYMFFARNWTMSNLRYVSGALGYQGKYMRGLSHRGLTEEEMKGLQGEYIKHLAKMALSHIIMSKLLIEFALFALATGAVVASGDKKEEEVEENFFDRFDDPEYWTHLTEVRTSWFNNRGQRIYIISPLNKTMRDLHSMFTNPAKAFYNKSDVYPKQAIEQIMDYSFWHHKSIVMPGSTVQEAFMQRWDYFLRGLTPYGTWAEQKGKVKTLPEKIAPVFGAWVVGGDAGGKYGKMMIDFKNRKRIERNRIDYLIDELIQTGDYAEAIQMAIENKRYSTVQGIVGRIKKFDDRLHYEWTSMSKVYREEFLMQLDDDVRKDFLEKVGE